MANMAHVIAQDLKTMRREVEKKMAEFSAGNHIYCVDASGQSDLTKGRWYVAVSDSYYDVDRGETYVKIFDNTGGEYTYNARRFSSNSAVKVNNAPQTNQGGSKMRLSENLNQYFQKHQETIFTIAFVLLVDYFLFQGALRKKVQDTVENLLKKADKNLSAPETK